MVVGLALAAIQMGMALPTGFLFGVGYGTGVRVGYEQVYPLLFPKGARSTTSELAATMKGMNTVYDAIGGKDASRMGIAVGIINAGEILNNPDFQVLEKLESSSSGLTSSSSSRSASGRGSLDLSVSSSEEILAEELASFNKLTNAEIWIKVRALTTGQILNSRTGTGMSAAWMEITGKVLAERLQSDFKGPSTPVKEIRKVSDFTTLFSDPKNEATTPEALQWISDRDFHLREYAEAVAILNDPVQAKRFGNAQRSKKALHLTALRKMARDYRNPNNFIRTSALALRQILSTL